MKFVFLVMLPAAVTLSACGAAAPDRPGNDNVAVLDAAWSSVDRHYYDRDFNGLDWPAVRVNYAAKAKKAGDPVELYWEVLQPMLRLLESSHTSAAAPSGGARTVSSSNSLEVMEPSWGRCVGFLASYGRSATATRIVSISKSSPLYKVGVRPGWRLLDLVAPHSPGSLGSKAIFLQPNGQVITYSLRSFDPSAVGVAADQLVTARRPWGDHEKNLPLEPLGISVVPGNFGTAPTIVRVSPGSAAASAGMAPGGSIQEVSDKPGPTTGQRSLSGVIRDRTGKDTHFSIDYTCARSDARPAVMRSAQRNGVLVLRFDRYSLEVAEWVRHEVRRSGPIAVILDLRENSGGSVEAMQHILGNFLPTGTPVGSARTSSGEVPVKSVSSGRVLDVPLAVLTSPVTASAAEVTASALRHYKRAVLIGQRTAGEVVVSNSYDLPDGGRVQVPVSDFLGPDGVRLEKRGVAPNRAVWNTLQGVRAGRDETLELAIALIKPQTRE